MSNKWGRQLERNAKRVDAQRKRLGQSTISETVKHDDRHYGRSVLLTSFLFFVGVFYMVTFWGVNRDTMYWVTVCAYLGLAFIVFLFRRPLLIIGKNSLATRKFAGFKSIKADEIDHIEMMRGYVIVIPKSGKSRWVFSRMIHRYNTERMTEKLKDFARANHVQIKQS